MKILVTGGAGYVGTTLIPMLLDAGHEVNVVDNLMYGGEGLLPVIDRIHFEKVDLRSDALFIGPDDVIVHLAAIVGFPACRRDPALAKAVNEDVSRNLAETVREWGHNRVIYASTGSNYGALDGLCTEESELNPISVYAETKCAAEKVLVEAGATALRFATAYGVSPRMRLDLLINDFTNKAMIEKHLVVYEAHFKRSFIHVTDMARAILFALEHPEMAGQVYNVGDESQNFSKADITEMIRSKTGCYVHYAEVGKDEDARNYEVSYAKIRGLGFRTLVSVDQGIDELIKALPLIRTVPQFSNA